MRKTLTVTAMVAALALGLVGTATASPTMLSSFTQAELDDNWEADRQFPSGGVTSVTAHGRTDVAAIGVVAADQSDASFRQFEGIKKVDDFGAGVQVDLYVPAEWEDADTSPLNVGFWATDDPISAYPLIVFRNGATVDAGFYVYDTTGGAYVSSGVDVAYGAWNTLSITLDPDTESVNYAINGQDAGASFAENGTIGQVFLNQYNDGVLDYTAYWHAGIKRIESKDECKKGNWKTHPQGFKNQGQCIKFVNTGK